MATATTEPSVTTAKMLMVDPFDPRLVVDETANGRFKPYTSEDVVDLREDIARNGVMEPVLVYKTGKDKLKVFAGFGRTKAVRDLKEMGINANIKLPLRVFELNEQEAFRRNISENQRRRSTTVVDDAHNVRRLSEVYGMTDPEILQEYARDGKPMSPAWLVQTRKILRLSPDLQQKIHNEKLAASLGYELADLPEEVREETLAVAKELARAEAIADTGVPAEQVEQIVEEANKLVQATTQTKINATPNETIVREVQKAAERRGLSKAKAKKVAAAAKKIAQPKPERKHVQKAATKVGGKEDKRVRKLGEVKELVDRLTEPGVRDIPAALRKQFQAFAEWMEGGRNTEETVALLVKPFKA